MHKTTVYLNDEEVDAVRQLAATTGRSQAEVIREAIRHAAAQSPPRQFRSLGKGQNSSGIDRHWNPAAVYAKIFSDSNADSATEQQADSSPDPAGC